MNLILLDTKTISEGVLLACDERYQHITKILNLTQGDTFVAGILNRNKGVATICELTCQYLKFNYNIETPVEAPLPITLTIGATRPSVMRRILRDVASVGVESIYLFHAENTEKSYMSSSLWRDGAYETYLKQGLEQATGVYLPRVERFYSLSQALQAVPSHAIKLALHPNALQAVTLSALAPQQHINLIIGNERGFTENELATLSSHHYTLMRMGTRVLRTETSCIAATILVAHMAGLLT